MGILYKTKSRAEITIISFLFFGALVVGYIFMCTDADYNYNQQMARGYISKDDIFFNIDDLSYREAFYFSSDLESFNGDTITIDISHKDAEDKNFVLENRVLDDGLTAGESLLTTGEGNYMAALHSGDLRGIVYKGNIMFPPILSGRFFTEEECLSDNSLALIGKDYESMTFNLNGKMYIELLNREYEVIGVIGLSSDSSMDNIIFVNIGSLTPKEQLNGIYYIDGNNSIDSIFEKMICKSYDLFGCDLKQRKAPTAFVDVASGGIYMKSYLRVIFMMLIGISFVNVFLQSIKRKKYEIAVMKVQGIHCQKIFVSTTKNYVMAFFLGFTIGIICDSLIILSGMYSIPVLYQIKYCVFICVIEIILIIAWLLSFLLFELKLNPKGVIHLV